jgi:hypothetical protein
MEKLLAKGGSHNPNAFAFIVWGWNNFYDVSAGKSTER